MSLPQFHLKVTDAISGFLSRESTSGLLLFGSAVVAMVLANSGVSSTYFDFWHYEAGINFANFHLEMSLVHWINDGLMALFFLVIGLEIKRELMVGELSTPAKAAFPAIAALGGMLVPALIYMSFNLGEGGQFHGFGIPMATDIAFALGFLMLLGKRVPTALKIFLTSLAVIDDIGAIVVIAVFYAGAVNWGAMAAAAGFIAGLLALNLLGVKKLVPYLLLGLGLWYFVFQSGIHATIAGVVLALCIPVKQKITSKEFVATCRLELDTIDQSEGNRENVFLTSSQQDAVENIGEVYEHVQNPLVRLEHSLHPISSLFIMPLFALANAGVAIGGSSLSLLSSVPLGVMLGLLVGKPVGILGLSFIASKLGWCSKPGGVSWRQLVGAGILGGVGFTMSMFITNLAFNDADHIAAAKLAIVISSVTAGLLGMIYLWRQKMTPPEEKENSSGH